MSTLTYLTSLVQQAISRLNNYEANAKKVDELPHQTTLEPTSKIPVSRAGNSEHLTVQQIISSIQNSNYNQLLAVGTITVDGTDIIIPSGVSGQINGALYGTSTDTTIPITLCPAGFNRKDILVLTTSNTVIAISGEETDGAIVLAPPTPLDTIYITEFDVNDTSIGIPVDPSIGTSFVEKSDFLVHNFVGSGSDVVIPLLANGASEIRLQSGLTPLTSIDGFDLSLITGNPDAKVPYNGKVFLIRNTASAPITLKNFGDADFKFYSLSGTDVVIPVNGIITVKYGFGGSESSFTEYFRNWTEPIDLSGPQFKKKLESEAYADPILTGANAVIPLQPNGQGGYSFSNAGLTSIDGFGLNLITGNPSAEVPYPGKDILIFNNKSTNLILKHDGSGTADVKFLLEGGVDLVVPAGGKVWLKYGPSYCELIFKSWSEVDLSTKQDELNETNFGQFMDVDLATKVTPSVNDTFLGRDSLTNKAVEFPMDYIQPKLTNPITGIGTTNYVPKFTGSGNLGNSQIFDNGTNVGIGTTSPGARLDIRAQGALSTDIAFRIRNSTDTRNFLVVNGAGDVFNNGAGGGDTNTHFGENTARARTGDFNSTFGNQAGRGLTTGASNALFGYNAGRNITTASGNVLIGARAGELNNANSTVAIGRNALLSNISGLGNTAVGNSSLNLTTASGNTAVGNDSGYNNTTGQRNTFIGTSSGINNTTGQRNVYLGTEAGLNQTTGNNNFFVGDGSGRYEADGVTNLTNATNSLFIGDSTRGNASGQTNQIVIGINAIGDGSNSVVLGNSSITRTRLQGQVIMGTFTTAPTGIEGAIYYDSTTKKHRGFNGTSWNDLY